MRGLMITTAWGPASLVEEATVPQSNADKKFVTHVQLLSNEEGELLVRFAYATNDVARRGPVTLRSADMKKLAKSLEKTPKLRDALSQIVVVKRRSA